MATAPIAAPAGVPSAGTSGYVQMLLRPEERGPGNGVQVAAYRLGMILSGGVLIVLSHMGIIKKLG